MRIPDSDNHHNCPFNTGPYKFLLFHRGWNEYELPKDLIRGLSSCNIENKDLVEIHVLLHRGGGDGCTDDDKEIISTGLQEYNQLNITCFGGRVGMIYDLFYSHYEQENQWTSNDLLSLENFDKIWISLKEFTENSFETEIDENFKPL